MIDEKVEKIEQDYNLGLKYKDIQERNNITNSQLIYLIQKNKWKRKSNRSEALKKNKNAKGNKGGPGANKGNKRALKTGEYENIFSGFLSEEEQNIFDNYNIENKKEALLDELRILTIREMRMLKRIKSIHDKEKDMSIEKIVKRQTNSTNSNATETVTEATNVVNPLQKLEDALTRIQEAKRRCIESLGRIGIDNEKLKIEKEKLKIEQKRLELELQNHEGEEVEDTSETDVDLYGS